MGFFSGVHGSDLRMVMMTAAWATLSAWLQRLNDVMH